MNTSRTAALSKPTGSKKIPVGTLGYMRGRNRHRLHSLLLEEFDRSGLSQHDLASRLNKRPEVVSRMLGSAGNMRLDSVCDYFFAMDGGELQYTIHYPLEAPQRNYSVPDWIYLDDAQEMERPIRNKTQTSNTAIIELSGT